MPKFTDELIIKIQTTNLDKTPALERYVRDKLAMLRKYFNHFTGETDELIFEVEIGRTTEHHKQGEIFRAEINFTAADKLLRAEATEEDLYAAIDEAKDTMEERMRAHKTRHIDRIRKGAAKIKERIRGWYR